MHVNANERHQNVIRVIG